MQKIAIPQERMRANALKNSRTSCRMLRCTYHFTSDCIVERDPGLSQLRSKFGAELLLEAPDQRVAKRDESAVTQRCRHRIGKMTSEDLRVLDLDQNVTTCHLR